LEVGENVLDIEESFVEDCKPGQLYSINGRVLNEEKECVDNIDVAEDDVIMYEVKSRWQSQEND
jgi:hypothetical protein